VGETSSRALVSSTANCRSIIVIVLIFPASSSKSAQDEEAMMARIRFILTRKI
jgi:hypothetical protein